MTRYAGLLMSSLPTCSTVRKHYQPQGSSAHENESLGGKNIIDEVLLILYEYGHNYLFISIDANVFVCTMMLSMHWRSRNHAAKGKHLFVF